MRSREPLHPRGQKADSDRIVAVSPSGQRFGPGSRLPNLPPPKRIVVRARTLWVDGWVFRILPIKRSVLFWLCEQANRWCRRDPSRANKDQIMGVIEAVESRVKKAPGPSDPKQGKFDF